MQPPSNIQEVQASKLGDAPEAPLLHRQKSGHLSKHYIFSASCTMRFSWSVSCFCFQFYFSLFAAINVWIASCVWRETCSVFHLPGTLYFSLLSFNECSLFLLLHLACIFCLDFYSDLVISVYQGVFWPLVYVGFHQKSYFKKVRMVLEKRKNFMQKGSTKRSLCRLRLRLLHTMLDCILIVCLVIFDVAWLVSNDWDCLMSLWKNHALFLLFGSINLVFSFDDLFGLTWHILTHVDYKISLV
jgi:hypothetical protein